jgi:hypothetical protein
MLRRRLLAIVGVIVFFLIAVQAWFPAQAQISAESRLSRIETDLAGLRNQVNQLAAGRSLSGGAAPAIPLPSSSPSSRRQIASGDPQFDRLATLVIELKERVTKLEEQVTRLQRR